MSTYCISYDLNKSGQNYGALYEELKSSPNWCHPMDSTWLIVTGESPEQVRDRLRKHMDDNDTLLIIKVVRPYSGWLTQEVWGWLEKHVPYS
ncbi:SinR [Pseudoxanthomonas sp. Root65]|uniref:hypothetical protein n=1 Tax=Pseudoxanthomonas sp. Root65 TaxID=1736576 RepID=UPI0006F5C58A|nr:hypothetical protein [Pseudoxanthomonas sp. Root65]KRA51345.1 SinR [Pseudoxanthomonas sp. Root65]